MLNFWDFMAIGVVVIFGCFTVDIIASTIQEIYKSRRDTGSSAGRADEYPGAVVPDSDIPF